MRLVQTAPRLQGQGGRKEREPKGGGSQVRNPSSDLLASPARAFLRGSSPLQEGQQKGQRVRPEKGLARASDLSQPSLSVGEERGSLGWRFFDWVTGRKARREKEALERWLKKAEERGRNAWTPLVPFDFDNLTSEPVKATVEKKPVEAAGEGKRERRVAYYVLNVFDFLDDSIGRNESLIKEILQGFRPPFQKIGQIKRENFLYWADGLEQRGDSQLARKFRLYVEIMEALGIKEVDDVSEGMPMAILEPEEAEGLRIYLQLKDKHLLTSEEQAACAQAVAAINDFRRKWGRPPLDIGEKSGEVEIPSPQRVGATFSGEELEMPPISQLGRVYKWLEGLSAEQRKAAIQKIDKELGRKGNPDRRARFRAKVSEEFGPQDFLPLENGPSEPSGGRRIVAE